MGDPSENNGLAELDRNSPGPVDPKAIEAAWLKSGEYARVARQRRLARRAAVVSAFVLVADLIIVGIQLARHDDVSLTVPLAVVFAYCGAFAWALTNGEKSARRKFVEREEAIHRAVAVRRAEAAVVANDLDLSNLFGFNRALMNQYHGLTKDQAEKSFRYSQYASFVGLFILAAGTGLAFTPAPDLTKVTVAGLSGIGTVLSGYISRTFLRSHELSIEQFNNFFRQPLVSNYLLMAERLSTGLNAEAKNKATLMIIERTIEAARRAEDQTFTDATSRPRRPRRTKAKSSEPVNLDGVELTHS